MKRTAHETHVLNTLGGSALLQILCDASHQLIVLIQQLQNSGNQLVA